MRVEVLVWIKDKIRGRYLGRNMDKTFYKLEKTATTVFCFMSNNKYEKIVCYVYILDQFPGSMTCSTFKSIPNKKKKKKKIGSESLEAETKRHRQKLL